MARKNNSVQNIVLLIVLFGVVTVSGQYNVNVKQPQFFQSTREQQSPEDIRNQAEAHASGTLFEYLVSQIFDEANHGEYGAEVELDIPSVTPQCRTDFNQMMSDLGQGVLYPLSMLDASGKPQSGILQGNKLWTGRYDQCRDVTNIQRSGNLTNTTSANHDSFNAQYCFSYMTAFKKNLPPQIIVGLCIPDSCNGTDIDILILTGVLGSYILGVGYYPTTVCIPDPDFSTGAIVALCILSILGLLIVGGTGIEVVKYMLKVILSTDYSNETQHAVPIAINGAAEASETMSDTVKTSIQNEQTVDVSDSIQLVDSTVAKPENMILKWGEKFLLCFSALTNGKKILTVQKSGPYSHLAALNGIRVLSMFWVMLGHTFIFITQFVDNPLDSYNLIKRFGFQAVGNATFSVDSFFVLSGLLVTYFALNELHRKNGRLNWGLFYFHRFWRLTPVYMLVIMIWTTLVPHFNKGPWTWTFYTDIPGGQESSVKLCQKYWWTNLLYINNLYPKHLGKECLGWSWYLANDMQFFIISPIILYLLYRYAKVGYVLLGALMTACFTSLIAVSWKYDLSPGITQPNFHNSTDAAASDYIYVKPWTRINSYLVGMIAGYMLYLMSLKQWKMSKWGALLGWCSAIGAGIGIVYGLYPTTQGHFQTQAQAVFYQTVSRTLWSYAVAWVAVACAAGKGGPVNALLGWSAFGPLARLTYCAYLLHPIFMYLYYTSSVTPIHYTDYEITYIFFGHLVTTYTAAYVLSVCAESPFMALEKLILPGRGSTAKPPPRRAENSNHTNC